MVKVDTAPEDEVKANEADSGNIAQKISDNKFKHAPQSTVDAQAAEMAAAEESGGGDRSVADMTPEERRAALASQEEAGNSRGKLGGRGQQGTESEIPYTPQAKTTMLMRAMSLIGRGGAKGPTAGILVALTLFGGVSVGMLGGSSFWMSLEKNLTNENANDDRTNDAMRRAFNRMIANSATSCGKVQLTCKFMTATKAQIKNWKDGRFKVFGKVTDENGKAKGGEVEFTDPDNQLKEGERATIDKLVDSDGSVLDSPEKLTQKADSDVQTRDNFARVEEGGKSSFFGKMFTDVLAKAGLNKAKASPEEGKPTEVNEKAAADAQEKASSKVGSAGKMAWRALGGWQGATLGAAQIACMTYNITRITVGAVKVKWAYDLIQFGWPFIRLIAKTYDGSTITDADRQEAYDKFTQLIEYLPISEAEKLKKKVDLNTLDDSDKSTLKQYGIDADGLDPKSDDYSEQKQKLKDQIDYIKNKSALDSQSLLTAMYGDTSGLSSFTQKFTTSAIGSATALASSFLGTIENTAGFGDQKFGKQNIRTACITASALANGASIKGIAECAGEILVSGPAGAGKCALGVGLSLAGWTAIFAGVEIGLKSLALYIVGVGVDRVVLQSDLKGPAAGDALSAMMGLLLTRKSQGSALKPALSLGAVDAFVASTGDINDKYGDQLAYYRARSTPFDTSNQYSFMGQIMQSLNPYPSTDGKPSGFSFLSNMFGVVSNSFLPTANALHSQPSLLTTNQANLNARTNNGNCPDVEKSENGMICDMGNNTVNITSPRVLQWAEEDAEGKSNHLSEIIDWLQKPESNPEGLGSDSGTKDVSCNTTEGFANQINSVVSAAATLGKHIDVSNMTDCYDSDKNASIDDTGKAKPGSQFEKYVKYCTDQRELEMGSTDISTDDATAKELDWHSGKQCGKTYDSNGNASDSDKFDPSKDTGEGSYMMDAFAYYYNMCYVQYAAMNGASDCTNDNPPDGGSSGSTTSDCGDGTRASIYTCALQFDPYTYQMGGGHPQAGTVAWYQNFKSSPPTDPNALKLDCSSLVMASLVAAFGKDVPNMVAPSSFSGDKKNWQSIPKDQAQRGDVIVQSEHVEIIKDNDPSKQYFTTFGAHTDGAPIDKQIGESGYSYSDVTVGTYRYIGPGAGSGGGNINV